MTKTIVQKYGGSSVADVDKIRAVAKLVKARREEGHRVVVVVSAMGKTTDGLLQMAAQMAKAPPRRELDMLLTTGERASAALMAMALHDVGVDAISFTGSQAGIITNATHAGARVLEVRPYRVQDELDGGRVVVLAGFQGVSYAKEITTLGRGGSDTTAVALAAALDADCEIYSDVDGVFTSDPRVVPEAVRIESLTHEEMQELAAAGAKVLNAQAVQFAKSKGIAIFALQTGVAGAGTVIRKDAPPPVGGVRGVAHKNVLHRLVSSDLQRLPAMLAFLEQHQLPVGPILAIANNVEILVPPEDAHGFQRVCKEAEGFAAGVDVGAVSLVGQGILDDPRLLSDCLRVLAAESVDVVGVSTSSFRITFLVPADPEASGSVGQVARLLHQRFVKASHVEPA
ncbi:MAG: aspartate kinase [Deltaproteobacteria bacterium]|nr:aspartate kinase [Deltaproteobacteria bacterium]